MTTDASAGDARAPAVTKLSAPNGAEDETFTLSEQSDLLDGAEVETNIRWPDANKEFTPSDNDAFSINTFTTVKTEVTSLHKKPMLLSFFSRSLNESRKGLGKLAFKVDENNSVLSCIVQMVMLGYNKIEAKLQDKIQDKI